jgi:V/A-type H+/Na+-transporting ATPase subunit D
MAKIKYTKNELKKQKDNLARFNRFLPTLELKKMQLVSEVRQVQDEKHRVQNEFDKTEKDVTQWVEVFAEDVDLNELFTLKSIKTHRDNIAGIEIPVFDDVEFEDSEYDLYLTPLWVDRGIAVVKKQIHRKAELQILEQKKSILEDELRITVQRIKLFEEVKIPEAKENIRIIQIFLGDEQTAAVVRGKIAKAKLERKKRQEQVR